jgi:hypothetical protein
MLRRQFNRRSPPAERFIRCNAPLPSRFHPDVYTSVMHTCEREKGHPGGHKAVTLTGRVDSWEATILSSGPPARAKA